MAKPSDNRKQKFRFSLVNDVTHDLVWSFHFTKTTGIIAVVSGVFVLLLLIFCLIAFTPIRTFIPGYPDANSKRQAIQNAMRIDSLETKIIQWELYTENLRKVVEGEKPMKLDSIIVRAEREKAASKDEAFLAKRDSVLRAEVAASEKYEISGTARSLPIEAMYFFAPVKGVVTEGFNASHPYIDVTAPAKSRVSAVLDGTVIFTDWDEEKGYTVVIQHSGDVVSIYANNEKLLKGVGDIVRAGTPVALLGRSESLTAGDHLHFELWYKGEALDPSEYISF